MSVYIHGMEKSKTCAFCRFCEGLADTQLGSCAFCVVDGKTRVADTPPKDCPLIPVPEHGDLIGRNPLIDIAMHLRNRAKDEYTKRVIGSVIRYIAEAPTIIPADHFGDVNEMVADKEGEG